MEETKENMPQSSELAPAPDAVDESEYVVGMAGEDRSGALFRFPAIAHSLTLRSRVEAMPHQFVVLVVYTMSGADGKPDRQHNSEAVGEERFRHRDRWRSRAAEIVYF